MEEAALDSLLVPLGLSVLGLYHVWLVFTIFRNPRLTVIALNAESRQQWVFSIMADPLKNGVLAVQTIRNNIMASTLLATTAITLCSLISVFASSVTGTEGPPFHLIYGNKTPINTSIKYFSILLCFLLAFLCNVQSIRYYAHVSFLVTVPPTKEKDNSIRYAARSLNRGSFFWTLGLRAFYLSFPLFLWIFGPIPMFVCCCVMSFVLYFLDTTSSFTRELHSHSIEEDAIEANGDVEVNGDVESAPPDRLSSTPQGDSEREESETSMMDGDCEKTEKREKKLRIEGRLQREEAYKESEGKQEKRR